MARKPHLKFSYQSKNNIWKIHAFPSSEFLVLELRDQSTLKVTFDVLTLEGKVHKHDITFDEDWWISVVYMYEKEVIFYTFDGAGNPEVKSLLGYDLNNDSTVWEKEPFDIQKYAEQKDATKNISVINPFHYMQGADHFNTVADFFKDFLNIHIVKAVDYLEHDSNILVSYFIEEHDKLANKLLIINEKKEILLHEKLGNFDNGISDNTFFIIDNTLIFVKGFRDFFMYDI